MQATPWATRVGDRPVLVAFILGITAVVGFIIGTWIGSLGPSRLADTGAVVPSLTPSTATATSSGSAAPVAVADVPALSGSADLTTGAFMADGEWQLDWETRGEAFALTIHGQPDLGTVIDHKGAGEGTISPIPAGTFSIEVRATGPWNIRVSPGIPSRTASAAPISPGGPREIILDFSGTDHAVSPPFEVVPGWQIQWQTDGSSLAIAVTGDQNLGIVVEEPGPASGVRSLAAAGNFRLDIAANGPWSITIIQGEEAAASPS